MFFIVAYFITVKLSNLYVIPPIKLLTIRYLYQHLVFRDALKIKSFSAHKSIVFSTGIKNNAQALYLN